MKYQVFVAEDMRPKSIATSPLDLDFRVARYDNREIIAVDKPYTEIIRGRFHDLGTTSAGGTIKSITLLEKSTTLASLSALDIDLRQFYNWSTKGALFTLKRMLSGEDAIAGSFDDDFLFGFSGDDAIRGRSGKDVLVGGGGSDSLHGDSGRDRLRGNDQADLLAGDAGDDKLWGGAGDDRLSGGKGGDDLSGDAGKDRLAGNRGRDVLDGGRDDDILSGGGGKDRFVIRTGTGNDRVVDFSAGDEIDLSHHRNAKGFAQLDISTDGADAVIRLGGDRVFIEGARASEFTPDDFIF